MKNFQKITKAKRYRRHKRVRTKIKGTNSRPRLSIFRSNRHIWCQLINDVEGKTIAASGNTEIQNKQGRNKTSIAFEVGKLIAQKARKEGIKEIVFDRGSYQYHGRVKALADGAREEGLKF